MASTTPDRDIRFTFPATEHHRPLAGTKLYCLVTEAHVCEQLARSRYMKWEWPVELLSLKYFKVIVVVFSGTLAMKMKQVQ